MAEWTAILDTSAVNIISPAAAKDIREHRIVPSRHVHREKPGEGVELHQRLNVGGVSLANVTPTYASLNDLLLQREVALGDSHAKR